MALRVVVLVGVCVAGAAATRVALIDPGDDVEPFAFNFASSRAGARVLASSGGVESAQSCLTPDPDRYLLIDRQSERVEWFVAQLSEDVTVERIVLQNSEFYATSPAIVEVSVSPFWPTEKWLLAGTLRMGESRRKQTFTLHLKRTVRFVKIRFLAIHHPDRFCTLTSLQVYGTPALAPVQTRLDASTSNVDALLRSQMEHINRLTLPENLSAVELDDSCPVRDLISSLRNDAHRVCQSHVISRQAQQDLSRLWELAHSLPDSDTMYGKLADRLTSIELRQRLLLSTAETLSLHSMVFLRRIRHRLSELETKTSDLYEKQRSQLQDHVDLTATSDLHSKCQAVAQSLSALLGVSQDVDSRLSTVLYLAVAAIVVLFAFLVCLLWR
ncbi:unnamed protein product (mitochondrion) [Plasmodiophora brassicae]|uniref:SUN domain-containing protein n=1 Tax=Plasmodiophora brassicae TaxID=37360 RepID=A0A0G4J7C9_PLABS|nr:hypothetical protein PBRA_009380 [Plasmodiophora brassicae]SPQ99502.1 unnamed protein product [Plasmodiophora brassicae]